MMIIMRQYDDGQDDDHHIINILSCGNWSHLFASQSTQTQGGETIATEFGNLSSPFCCSAGFWANFGC